MPLDPRFPDWGDSRYVRLRLSGTVRLADALNQLYLLLPVLDGAKHYWVGISEVDKLVRGGGDWLASHPRKGLIMRRYLARKRGLERVAYARLAEVDETGDDLEPPVDEEPAETADPAPASGEADEPSTETEPKPLPLNRQRHAAVLAAVEASGAESVIDLGCGSGKLLTELIKNRKLTRIAGTDVSTLALKLAARQLRLDRLGDRQADRLSLFQGALTYTDDRFAGFDAAVLMEVIEHVDPPRLAALEKVVFGSARPATVIVTTPNVEYNVHYELEPGRVRHNDHRFEWDRRQFTDWANTVAAAYDYTVDVSGVGEEKPETGCPTQMGVFTRG